MSSANFNDQNLPDFLRAGRGGSIGVGLLRPPRFGETQKIPSWQKCALTIQMRRSFSAHELHLSRFLCNLDWYAKLR